VTPHKEKRMSKEFDVEQGLSRLQEINTKLSEGDLPLGEAMKLYKEGVELANKCKENLEGVKTEIKVINGEVSL
jgi:exodeoxyribonuclease VII small subunit